MNILNKLTLKNLKLNKSRTIVTAIGIILSVALIVGVATLLSSFYETTVDYEEKTDGDFHATFNNVDISDMKYITNNLEVERYYLKEDLGTLEIYHTEDYTEYISVVALDEYNMNLGNVGVLKGRKPENTSELIISSYYSDNYDVKVDDVISIDLQTGEGIVNYTYTVVGIMGNSYPAYKSMYTVLDEIKNSANIQVVYKDAKNYEDITKSISEGLENPHGYEHNDYLLDLYGYGYSNSVIETLVTVGSILAFIIMLTSVFCIRNSFAISVTEKTKQYGMLSSIGATKKQIKRNVLFEALLIGLVSIPLGIISGIVAMYILIIVINVLIGSALQYELVLHISTLSIFVALSTGLITIYLSSISAARKASKITQIEAIKGNKDIFIKKKIKTPKIINKLFGVGGVIAFKNMKRNKKKFGTTIVSLAVSIFIFITLSSFMDMGFNVISEQFEDIPYNFEIYNYDSVDNEIFEKAYNDFKSQNTVEKYFATEGELRMSSCDILLEEYLEDTQRHCEDGFYLTINILEDHIYNEYIKELGYEYENVFDKALVYKYTNTYSYKENKSVQIEWLKDIKLLNTVSTEFSATEEVNYELALDIEMVDKLPFDSYSLYNSDSYYIFVSEEVGKQLFNSRYSGLMFEVNDDASFEEYVINYIDENSLNLSYENIEFYVNQINSTVLLISILLYGFISVIILIGLTNVFNTLTTSIKLRSSEFATYQSIGMTKGEFNKLILLESCFYGFKSLLYGLPLGILMSYIIYDNMNLTTNGMEVIDYYQLPINAIIISIVFIFIIIYIIMKFSLNKINKQNIIETIRNENI